MKILVTGANGFIASAICQALLGQGHSLVAVVRSASNLPSHPAVTVKMADMTRYTTAAQWVPLLHGVDAVINVAGILREANPRDFQRIHFDAPKALAEACQQANVRQFIQISAIGAPEDGEFIASKHRFDDWLLQAGVPCAVIRPSVVISTIGSYGGTSMLRALSATPYVLALPGDGRQPVQPILLEDLAALVAQCIERGTVSKQPVYAVGPEVMSIEALLRLLRNWLKLPRAVPIHVPLAFVKAGAWLGERFTSGPLNSTILALLMRGNVAPEGAHAHTGELTGFFPRSISIQFSQAASFVQDRWHARLYLLRPLLWFAIALVWLVSGMAGLLATPAQFQPILSALHIPLAWQANATLGFSLLDLALCGLWLLRIRPRLTLWLMLASVLGYTGLLGVLAPSLWLDPLGGLLKNLAILPLLLLALVLEGDR